MSSWEVLIDLNPLYTYEPPYNINNKYVPEMLLDLEVNKAGQFTFKVYDGHPLFSNIHMLKSTVSVTDENRNVRFFGRPISDTIDFDNVHTIVCEGALAYLNDVVIRPSVINVTGINNSGLIFVQKYLEKIIELYNLYASPNSRKFRVGNITVNPTPFRGVWRVIKNTEYISVMDYVRQYLIDAYGGYLQVREGYDEDTQEDFIYLDYLAELTDTGTQGITFAQNLLDIQTDMDGASLVTAIIPIGDDDENGNPITISNITDGKKSETVWKRGDYIYSPSASVKYGLISRTVKFDGISNEDDLLDAAINYFDTIWNLISKTTVTSTDLHYATGYNVPTFKIGTVVPITSSPHQQIHGFNNTALIRKLDINMLDASRSNLVVETSTTNLGVTLNNYMSNHEYGYFAGTSTGTAQYSTTRIPPDENCLRSLFCTGEESISEVTRTSSASIALNPTHFYYVSFLVYKPITANGSFDFYWPIQEPPVISSAQVTEAQTWTRISKVFERNLFAAGNYKYRWDYNNLGTREGVYVSAMLFIDLTEAFGAGFEPSQEWCDEYIKWFDETAII